MNEVPEKNYSMGISFANGRYIEMGVSDVGFAEVKKNAFKALKKGDIMEMENICFRCQDASFIAFFDKSKSTPLTDKPVQPEIKTDQDS